MKKAPAVFLAVSGLVLSFRPLANANIFALGLLAAAAAGSDSVEEENVGVNVLYTLPRVRERLVNPLGVRLVSTPALRLDCQPDDGVCRKGMTLVELFQEEVKEADKFVLLQVLRVMHRSDSYKAYFWFVFTEPENLRPISELEPVEEKK